MPYLVHEVNRGVRMGLFIYQAFSLSAVFFPSLAFGSLPSSRKETDLAGMFFVPASLFTGEEGDRFIITTLSGGWGEKVSAGTTMPVSSFTVKTVPPAALVPPPPREPSACPLPFPLQAGSGRRRHGYIPAPSPHTPKLLRAITTAALALPGPPPLPQPPRCGVGEPGARRGQRQRAPDPAGAGGLSASCAVSPLQARARPESRRLADTHGSTHTVELSRSTFLHTAPSFPPSSRSRCAGRVTGASRQPAPGRAGRSGARGQLRRVFRRPRRRRGWDAGRSPSLGRGGDGCHQ